MTATRYRPTVAQIDLGAIRHNVGILHPPGAEVMAVVKANAYGHGAVPVAAAAVEGGATWLGVALVEEGLELRAGGLTAPVFVLTEFPPGSFASSLRGTSCRSVRADYRKSDGPVRAAPQRDDTISLPFARHEQRRSRAPRGRLAA